ncbi:MAG: hypothetical protein OEX03_05165 [Gammaproteobacteria bacterium]|nr:hypothetical protein [Gammaproteobacteria bacterium]
MVTPLTTIKHDVMWLSPSPMWAEYSGVDKASSRNSFLRPSIFRFNHDEFMDEMLGLLSYHPDRLMEWQALPETWRKPMADPTTASHLKRTQTVSHFSKAQNKLARNHGLADRLAKTYKKPDEDELDYSDFKLYQPAHQRYYLISASLVCRQAGLPERLLDDGKQEKVGFVLRRIVNRDPEAATALCDPENTGQCDEYAFVQTEDGPQWQLLDSEKGMRSDLLFDNEERLPLFGLNYSDNEIRSRRLYTGMIPVSRREAYLNARTIPLSDHDALAEDDDNMKEPDPRRTLFEMDVTEPWKSLLEQAASVLNSINGSKDIFKQQRDLDNSDVPADRADIPAAYKRSREQIQTVSWYVLLDFERFLQDYLKEVWEVVAEERLPEELGSDEERDIITALQNITMSSALIDVLTIANNSAATNKLSASYHVDEDCQANLLLALRMLAKHEEFMHGLEAVDVDYDRNPLDEYGRPRGQASDARWPRMLFPLADPQLSGPLPALAPVEASVDPLENNKSRIDALVVLIGKALAVNGAAGNPEVPSRVSPLLDKRDAWFIVRCFYERPNCGPYHSAVMSRPCQPFQMASFFDPDAPGRKIKIPMPMDISPAGLRKFNRNTTFMISDMLCGKLKSIRKLTFMDLVLSVLPWPFHKDLPKPDPAGKCQKGGDGFGMFCSLSIPIVTLCAMVLLIIMVSLFDIFFRWLPYLFVCLPIPGLGGKKS